MPYQMSIISRYVEERTELNTDAPIAQRIECPATGRSQVQILLGAPKRNSTLFEVLFFAYQKL